MIHKPTLKAILSDAGDILFFGGGYTKAFFYDFVQQKSQSNGHALPPRDEVYRLYRKHRNRSFTEKGYSYGEASREALRDLGMEQYTEEYLSLNRPSDIYVADQINETLQRIRMQGLDFYIVSDSDKLEADYWRMLERLGIKGVQGIVSSKDIEAMKPASEFFDFALKKYELKPEEAIFLAHDFDELEGAHRYGFPTIIACSYDPADDLSFIPDERKCKEFKDVPGLLEKLL